MSYLIVLQEQLRPFAREVFLRDRYFERIYMIRTNKHARIFLRCIIRRAKDSSLSRNFSFRQLARLFGLSRTSFEQWFRYNARVPIALCRVRRFLNEMIRLNAEEDLRPSSVSSDLDVEEKPIELPSAETKAVWKRRMDDIREAYRNRGPQIKNVTDAVELIGWMQSGYSSASSSEDGSRRNSFGENPNEEKRIKEYTSELDESRGLNGRPDIIINQQLLDKFDKILSVSNESDSISKDNQLFCSGVDDQSNQSLCLEDDVFRNSANDLSMQYLQHY